MTSDGLLSTGEIEQIGIAHNLGLDAIINTDAFNTRYAKFSQARQKTTADTLELLRFFEDESIKFLKKQRLYYRGKAISSDKFGRFSEKELLSITRIAVESAKEVKYYKSLLEQALIRNEFDHSSLEKEVSRITNNARRSVKNTEELNVILIGANVLLNSHEYWLNFNNSHGARTSANPCAQIPIIATTIEDLGGALGGGALGTIIGPIGTIFGSITGALSGSLTGYAVSIADCGFNKHIYGGHGGSSGSSSGGSGGGPGGPHPGGPGGGGSTIVETINPVDPCAGKRKRTASLPWGKVVNPDDPCP